MAVLIGPPAALVAMLVAAAWGLFQLAARRQGVRGVWAVRISAASCLVLAAVFAFVAVFHAVTA